MYLKIYRVVLVGFLSIMRQVGSRINLFQATLLILLATATETGRIAPTFRVVATGLGHISGIILSAGHPACSAAAIIFMNWAN